VETNKPATLCWKCAKACGKCSWSNGTFEPVEGWKAERSLIMVRNHDRAVHEIESYFVEECPEFIDDTDQYNQRVKRNKWNSAPYLQEVTV
jgi:hypothetical protein